MMMATPVGVEPARKLAPVPAILAFAEESPTDSNKSTSTSLLKQVREGSRRDNPLLPPAFLGAATRNAILVSHLCTDHGDALAQLEELVGTIEDSFASTEQTLDEKARSPRTQGKLQAEKMRRQKLLGKLAKLISSSQPLSGVKVPAGEETTGVSQDSSDVLGDSIASTEGTSEWKHSTLLRLRKFLRKQYRMRKSKLVQSAEKESTSPEDLETERTQLLQVKQRAPAPLSTRPPLPLPHPAQAPGLGPRRAATRALRCTAHAAHSRAARRCADCERYPVDRAGDPAAV